MEMDERYQRKESGAKTLNTKSSGDSTTTRSPCGRRGLRLSKSFDRFSLVAFYRHQIVPNELKRHQVDSNGSIPIIFCDLTDLTYESPRPVHWPRVQHFQLGNSGTVGALKSLLLRPSRASVRKLSVSYLSSIFILQ